MKIEPQQVRTTCPRDCYDACGVIVSKANGIVLNVTGDPSHPHNRGTLCAKCTLAYNGSWRDPSVRLTHPLRRNGPKGSGIFVKTSWVSALAEISKNLNTIRSEFGGHSIIQTHYTGTCSLLAYSFPLRFFNKIGATEVDPDTICNKAGHMALELMFGSSLDGFDPRTAKDSDCIIVWGANPSASAPNTHRYWLTEFPGKVIVIDPIRHRTAAAANLHLQPIPGSDAALAFALLHVLVRENMVDQAFLRTCVRGWDGLADEIDMCTPKWGETVTGVPPGLIVEAATTYGSGKSLLWLGQGLQRQSRGGNVFRACSLLPVATGNIGKPGCGFMFMNGQGSRGVDADFLPAPHLGNGTPSTISHMDLAATLEDITKSKALVCWNNNIVASCPQQARLKEALQRDDLFTVAIDLFATDTTDYADIVLPAASFLEFDDLVIPYFNYSVSAQTKACEPLGESLPNQEIFRRIASTMGLDDPELHTSDRVLIDEILGQTRIELTFEQLSEIGTTEITANPVMPFANSVFPTPSGKIEIDAAGFVEHGLPKFPEAYAEPRPPSGMLQLLSPASPWLMNSSYDNVAKVRNMLADGEVLLSDNEANHRKLKPGNQVEVSNDTGSICLRLVISADVPDGVALVHKGRWPKLDPTRANVNVLNPGTKSDLGESSSVHSILVNVALPSEDVDYQ